MDLEPNAWSALVRGRWAEKVVGWFLLGDHKVMLFLSTSNLLMLMALATETNCDLVEGKGAV